MVKRRCVICGKNPPEKDADGNEAYAYPRTDQEARLWQISMQADCCCMDSIKKKCCICVEHIPDFVERAKSIRIGRSSYDHKEHKKPKAAATDESCQCLDEKQSCKCKVGVLLLNGASLPIYCAEGQTCEDSQQQPAGDGDPKNKVTKKLHLEDSDTEVIVKESGFQDSGGKFPDIDGTEVTVLRTPTQEGEELALIEEKMEETEEQKEDTRKHRNMCLRGCTDVLLLGRGHHPTDDCPCQCEQCSKTPQSLPEPETCCLPCITPCCEKSGQEIEYFTQPPCGCECEQQARQELGKVIKTQKKRINELEELLCRHNNTRSCLQRKLDELYCEFGRLDDAESEAHESGVRCPGSERGGPDCPSVLLPPILPEPTVQKRSRRSFNNRRSTKRASLNPTDMPLSRDLVEIPPPGERVHWLAGQSPETDEFTRRPLWVNKRDDEMGRYSLRFSRAPSAVMYTNFNSSNTAVSNSNSSYTAFSNTNYSNTNYTNSNTNTNYSLTNYSNTNSNTNYNTNYSNSNTNANSIYTGVNNSISQSQDNRSYRSGMKNSISQSNNSRSYRSQA